MNVATRNNTDSETHISSPGPGSLLRNARKAAGLSLLDVTAKLHLDLKVIQALEEDDFSTLPPATFVRGYLRSYTQLLGLPIGPVLEALDNEHLSPPVLIADIAEEPQASSDDVPVRLVSYGVIAILTIMVVLWWHNQDFDYLDLLEPASEIVPNDSEPVLAPIQEAAQNESGLAQEDEQSVTDIAAADSTLLATGGSDAAITVQVQAADDPQAVATLPAQPTDDGVETDSTPEGASAVEQQLAQARDSIEASQEVLTLSQTQIESQSATEPVEATETADPAQEQTPEPVSQAQATPAIAAETGNDAQPSPLAPEGEDTLSMQFTRDSWVSVHDSNDRRLFYDLATRDRKIEVHGPGPLRVLLGRPQGITVLYNGKPMNLKSYINDSGIARFTGNQ